MLTHHVNSYTDTVWSLLGIFWWFDALLVLNCKTRNFICLAHSLTIVARPSLYDTTIYSLVGYVFWRVLPLYLLSSIWLFLTKPYQDVDFLYKYFSIFKCRITACARYSCTWSKLCCSRFIFESSPLIWGKKICKKTFVKYLFWQVFNHTNLYLHCNVMYGQYQLSNTVPPLR